MKLKTVFFLIGMIILASLIYFSGAEKTLQEIAKADARVLLAVLFISLFLMFVRTFRWKRLLEHIGIQLGIMKLFPIYITGMMVSNITPAKAGDPFRSYLLKKKTGIKFSSSLPSVVIERVADILIVVMFSLIGLASIKIEGSLFFTALAVILFYIFAISAIVGISSDRKRILRISHTFYTMFKWVPKIRGLEKRIGEMATNFNISFVRFRNWKALLDVFFITAFIWIVEAALLYLVMMAFSIRGDISIAAFALTIGILVGIASSLPGGLGSTDAVMAVIISTTLSISFPLATAAVLVHRLLTMWLSVLVGAVFLTLTVK